MQLTCYRNDILAIYNTMNHLNSAISVDVLNVAGSEALESSDRSPCCMFNFQKETRKLPVPPVHWMVHRRGVLGDRRVLDFLAE